jgi:serine/threonine protein kinase/Tol biopolymer transport system component
MESGQQLLHYRLVEKIGEGGMGEVFVAEDTKLHRRVALKVLPQGMATDAERRARFEREARAVAALNHPNIVTLHSIEEANTSTGSPSTGSGQAVHFITMELIEGQTLAELSPKRGLSPDRLLEIAIPLADAVSRAHRDGITHRDLKPDNVMVDAEGRLRVLDFGLAKLHGPSGLQMGTQAETATATAVTQEGKILGTVAYMSPEQAEGKEVDARSDVFSLGTILYEMATGARPFRGDTHASTIGAILKDEPASASDVKPSLPDHLGRIIRRCLAKQPDRRYQNAGDLRIELEELKAELAAGTATKAASSARRWIPVGIGAVVVIAALFALKLWRGPESQPVRYVPRPITSELGWEADVNWSPESEFIAYGQVRNGGFDVMVQPVAGGPAVVRASGPGDETTPRWSPDGKWLAYVSSSEPGSYIYLVPPHGGTPRKLIDTQIPTLDVEKVSSAMGDRPWSPDAKSLLVSRFAESGRVAIFRVERESGDVEQLTFPQVGSSDLSPSHSFDGKQIVFQRRTHGKGALMTLPAAGGEPEVLLTDEYDAVFPAFRPGDRSVLFQSSRGETAVNLWEIDLATRLLTQLTTSTHDLLAFSVSADDRIVFTPFWHDTFLFAVDVATGERRQLTAHTKDNFGARFSPDGSAIAYHSTRTGNAEIWLHYLDGRPETQVTDDSGWDLYPDWSPDGDRMIFVSDREEGQFKLFIANSDGVGTRRLVDLPISVRSTYAPVNAELVARWSPDGGRIAFLRTGEETNALWTIGPDGEGAQELLDNVIAFDWYVDARRGILTRPHGSESEIVAVDLDSGQKRSLFVGPLMEIDVAPDGSAIAFCYGRGHMGMGLAVLRLDPPSEPGGLPRAAGEPELVVPAEGIWHVHNGGWSEDSKTLVYTQDLDHGDIFELVAKQ